MTEEKRFYLTKSGFEKLKKEYEKLKKIKFPKTKKELIYFSRLGGISSECFYLRESLDFLNARMRELRNILENVELIKAPPKIKQNMAGFGAIVTLTNESGETREFMMVSELEVDPDKGRISPNSPVGKAIFGRSTGNRIKIDVLGGQVFKITRIRY